MSVCLGNPGALLANGLSLGPKGGATAEAAARTESGPGTASTDEAGFALLMAGLLAPQPAPLPATPAPDAAQPASASPAASRLLGGLADGLPWDMLAAASEETGRLAAAFQWPSPQQVQSAAPLVATRASGTASPATLPAAGPAEARMAPAVQAELRLPGTTMTHADLAQAILAETSATVAGANNAGLAAPRPPQPAGAAPLPLPSEQAAAAVASPGTHPAAAVQATPDLATTLSPDSAPQTLPVPNAAAPQAASAQAALALAADAVPAVATPSRGAAIPAPASGEPRRGNNAPTMAAATMATADPEEDSADALPLLPVTEAAELAAPSGHGLETALPEKRPETPAASAPPQPAIMTSEPGAATALPLLAGVDDLTALPGTLQALPVIPLPPATPASMAEAQPPAPALAQRAHLAAEAAPQLVLRMAQATRDGVESISVDLRPPELGRVELQMTFRDNTVQVVLRAEQPETFEALRQERHHLEQQMADAGLQLGSGGLDLQQGPLAQRQPEAEAPKLREASAETDDVAADAPAAQRPAPSDSLIDLIA